MKRCDLRSRKLTRIQGLGNKAKAPELRRHIDRQPIGRTQLIAQLGGGPRLPNWNPCILRDATEKRNSPEKNATFIAGKAVPTTCRRQTEP